MYNLENAGKLPNGTTGQYSASPKKVTEEDPFVPQSQAVNIPSTTQNEKKGISIIIIPIYRFIYLFYILQNLISLISIIYWLITKYILIGIG